MSNKEYYGQMKKVAGQSKVAQKKNEQGVYDAVKSFERDNISIIKSKASMWMRLAIAEFLIIGCMAIAISVMAPLKTAVPFLVRVDNNTGYTDIAPQLSNAKETYEEAEAKYFLTKYVINYESYDWETIQEQAETVTLMSNNKVSGMFNTSIRAENSPLNVLKDQYKIKVKVKPVVFLKPDLAQVRFTKMVLDNNGNPAPEFRVTDWIATIPFDYNKKIKTEAQRQINPLGLQVLSYRVDAEASK
ncbi:type IV secretion system protein [Salmonella enterica]|nr:type IV secretion system protein [Salmonella enterica]